MADRTVVYRLMADVTGFKAQMAAASASVKGAADSMTASTKEGAKFRQGLDSAGRVAGKVGLVAAAGLGAAVVAAANFDESMSAVQAATHESASNMEQLRAAALKAGADTKYSATEAAAGIENLAKAGVSTKDILGGGLSGALSLAAAGNIEVGDAAEYAASAMTQFKLDGSQVPHIADLLAAGAGKAQGEVSDLGQALAQSGLVANQTGLSIEETTGTLSAFASAGLIGSDAGTAFKTMLQALTPNSAKAKETMEKLGISAYDAQGNFIGMTEFAGQLHEALSGLSAEQQNAALKTIFGSDAVRAASVVYQQGADGIQGWIDKTNDAGYAAETAAIRMDNLKGDLEQLRGSLETALIGTGDGAQTPLRGLVQDLTKVVNAYNDLPPAAQGAVGKTLGVTAALAGGVWVFSKVVRGVNNTREALEQLGVTAEKRAGLTGSLGRVATSLVAIESAAWAVDSAMDAVFNRNIDSSNLQRGLDALSKGTWTDDLQKTASDIVNLNKAGAGAWWRNPVGTFTPWDPEGFDSSRDNIMQIDQALASMVESGNADQAAAAFAQIQSAASDLGVSVGETESKFSQYQLALLNASKPNYDFARSLDKASHGLFGMSKEQVQAAKAADGAATSTDEASSATGEYGTKANKAKVAAQNLAAAMQKQKKDAREVATQFIGLGDSVDKAKVSLGQWLHQLEKQAAALRDFTHNAQTAAKKGLDQGLIASLNEAGPAGALRMRQLANATDAEIKRANSAWRDGQKAIRDYVNMKVPPKWVGVDISQAISGINTVKNAIDALHDKTVTIRTVRQGGFGPQAATGSADGSTVPKFGEYRDRFPYMLAPGEEVISNRHGQADRHRSLLKAINAGRLADGGTAWAMAAQAAPSPASPMRVNFGDLQVVGTLNTPWGPKEIRGIARAEAADVVNRNRRRDAINGWSGS